MVINKRKIAPYENGFSNIEDNTFLKYKIPVFRTPEQLTGKGMVLEHRPQSFKINNRQENSFPSSDASKQNADSANKLTIATLTRKIKSLEAKCNEKDKEIDKLKWKTSNIVKQRDEIAKEFKEYQKKREEDREDEEDIKEYKKLRKAFTMLLNNQDKEEQLEDEGEGENADHNEDNPESNEDQNNYNYMLMAMANQLLSEKLEKEELEAAIKMSLADNENKQELH